MIAPAMPQAVPAGRPSDCNERTGTGVPRYDQSSTVRGADLESYGLVARLPLAQRSVLVQKVTLLEGRLFDDQGHRRRGASDEADRVLLHEINDLRGDLGWLLLDLHHDHIWPTDIAS
jgi:hypothetical protein